MTELDTKALREAWAPPGVNRVSARTVYRVIRRFGPKPIRRDGLKAIFSASQARVMFALWEREKAATLARLRASGRECANRRWSERRMAA